MRSLVQRIRVHLLDERIHVRVCAAVRKVLRHEGVSAREMCKAHHNNATC